MPLPTSPEKQVRFLLQVQRLLDEGSITASYKYALLLALADIAVESGCDTGESLPIPIERIAEKYIQYYWRQAVPYVATNGQPVVLQQNTLGQAKVLTNMVSAQQRHAALCDIQRNRREWNRLVKQVASVVVDKPLWRLQSVGSAVDDFLYENQALGSRTERIVLRPGVAFCLRRFHVLLTQLVRFDWLAYVRRVNSAALGSAFDLEEFLFGSDRSDPSGIRSFLSELQNGRCFYCANDVRSDAAMDHFIPWARYPVDLGHNFVLAHVTCNGKKGALLAAEEHLKKWIIRNRESGSAIAQACDKARVPHELSASIQIAEWAYEQTAAANGNVWRISTEIMPLAGSWRQAFLANS